MSVLRQNIDSNPYTGERKAKGQLRASTKEWLNPFFDGTPNYEQVTGITRGKIYDVVSVEGFGYCEDITFTNDNGEEQTLEDFFFEEVE